MVNHLLLSVKMALLSHNTVTRLNMFCLKPMVLYVLAHNARNHLAQNATVKGLKYLLYVQETKINNYSEFISQ